MYLLSFLMKVTGPVLAFLNRTSALRSQFALSVRFSFISYTLEVSSPWFFIPIVLLI